MATCSGCGGIIGRDCFNPVECEQISHEMDVEAEINAERKRLEQANYKQLEQERIAHIERYFKNYPGSWYQPLFDYMAKQHNIILIQSDLDEIISIVNTMQAAAHQNETK
jgi:hypothetical protein